MFAQHGTLVKDVAKSVTLSVHNKYWIVITNRGSAPIFATFGALPVAVEGDDTQLILSQRYFRITDEVVKVTYDSKVKINLITNKAGSYSVEARQTKD